MNFFYKLTLLIMVSHFYILHGNNQNIFSYRNKAGETSTKPCPINPDECIKICRHLRECGGFDNPVSTAACEAHCYNKCFK